MHSRIFQVSKEPITELIEEYRYEEYFVGNRADYVVKSEDRIDDLKWLAQATKGLEVDIDNMTIKLVSKAEYFERKFEEFQQLISDFSIITLNEFSTTKNDLKFYSLKSAYEDEHEFYIDDNDEYMGVVPIDEWVRNTQEGEVFHIGNTFDYHF